MEAVPGTRRGRPGTHRHKDHAPTQVINACETTPTTKDQYPHPFQARRIVTANEEIRENISLAENKEKRMARFRSARCKTERLMKKMVSEMAMATFVTRGL